MSAKIETSFCCPLCKGTIAKSESGFACNICQREYPLVAGIFDFRICPDPYIDIPADRAKALRIEAQAETATFADLVAFYYSITPEVPDDLARHYLNHHVSGAKRGAGILERVKSYKLGQYLEPGITLLDLGCGTGGFLAAARAQGAFCVGVDVALRWLVVARSRFREMECEDVTVICACADHLPFITDSFDLIVAENLLEHCSDTIRVLAEVKRIRRKTGAFMARTINRFAMAPEPHVGVWGVGFLPKTMMNGYVKLVKGIPYEHIHLESFGSLDRAIQTVDDQPLVTRVPLITEADYSHHPQWKQSLFKIYNLMMTKPGLGNLLARIGPYIDIVTKPEVFVPKGSGPLTPISGEQMSRGAMSGSLKCEDRKFGNSTSGDPMSGNPKSGDPTSGDSMSGNPKSRVDPKSGDPKSGDPKFGDPKFGDPKSGNPKSGDPMSGNSRSNSPTSSKLRVSEPTPTDLLSGNHAIFN
jgi:SAM-dependent methyltransferase